MERIEFLGRPVPLHRCGVLVIGSGCAAWNAADCLADLGVKDVLLVSEGLNMGTSRNTGSDKQTYYKLAMQARQPDSVDQMAEALAAGRSVHGDIAYAEAANSARCFLKLVGLGVPFPTNAYGEFVGYQTDHTTTRRASSAGPLTSRYMTEALEQSVRRKPVTILDGVTIVELLRNEAGIFGAVGISQADAGHADRGLQIFLADQVICATGGPASVYRSVVYPASQTGMTGMLMDAGVSCANLQEWQYGMASVQFRWNLSGTYQQVLPTYFSVDRDGVRREFLKEYFADPMQALGLVFLKGYQWPFDYAKLDGSSLIDLLVYHEEIELGRTVWLDYRRNPAGLERGFEALPAEACDYLRRSGALGGTPFDRLEKMNPAAVALYRAHGIDLASEPLQITVAAQHCNGGAAVDAHWQTEIPGLYVVGEAAGTFGVYRPGGSALNSTQVGSLRAAEQIRCCPRKAEMGEPEAYAPVCRRFLSETGRESSEETAEKLRAVGREMAGRMSACAAHIRDPKQLPKLRQDVEDALERLWDLVPTLPAGQTRQWFKTRDMLTVQQGMLRSMEYANAHIGSRGGSVYCPLPLDAAGAPELVARLSRMKQEENTAFDRQILTYSRGACRFVPARPLPQEDNWFETVWADYRRRFET